FQLQWALWILTGTVALLAIVVFRQQTTSIQSSEDKYKMLFDNSPLPKWIYDKATLQFLEVNDTAVREYGYSRDEFLAMTIADIRPREDVGRLKEDVEAIRSEPRTQRNSQWRHVKKDGEIIDVDVTAHNIDFEGHQARMVVASDITERRQHEHQL